MLSRTEVNLHVVLLKPGLYSDTFLCLLHFKSEVHCQSLLWELSLLPPPYLFLLCFPLPSPPPPGRRWGGGAVSCEEGSVSGYKGGSSRLLRPSPRSSGGSFLLLVRGGSSSSWASVTWNQPPAWKCSTTSCRPAATSRGEFFIPRQEEYKLRQRRAAAAGGAAILAPRWANGG